MHILIVEDEPSMQKILQLYLKREGFQTSLASDGEEALALSYETDFDLILLDWMLPRLSGIEVCRQLKEYNKNQKIILLTAKSETTSEITGLTYGADDYIKKPFDPSILLLRIKRILSQDSLLSYGPFTLDTTGYEVKQDGILLSLTKKEFQILKLFLSNPDKILTRDQLLTKVWGIDYEGDERTLDTHIKRLRAKIGERYIKTQVGLGYKMVKEDE